MLQKFKISFKKGESMIIEPIVLDLIELAMEQGKHFVVLRGNKIIDLDDAYNIEEVSRNEETEKLLKNLHEQLLSKSVNKIFDHLYTTGIDPAVEDSDKTAIDMFYMSNEGVSRFPGYMGKKHYEDFVKELSKDYHVSIDKSKIHTILDQKIVTKNEGTPFEHKEVESLPKHFSLGTIIPAVMSKTALEFAMIHGLWTITDRAPINNSTPTSDGEF